jgi:hypothetical protein
MISLLMVIVGKLEIILSIFYQRTKNKFYYHSEYASKIVKIVNLLSIIIQKI